MAGMPLGNRETMRTAIALITAVLLMLAGLNGSSGSSNRAEAAEPGDIEGVTLEQVGFSDLASPGHDGQTKPRGQNGDVSILGDHAYVGGGSLFHGAQWSGGRICTDYGGVKVVDISDPANPSVTTTIDIVDIAGTVQYPVGNPRRGQKYDNVSVSAGAVDAMHVDNASFTGDVLAIAIQRCEQSFFAGARVEFWDITDPATPAKLGEFNPASVPNPNCPAPPAPCSPATGSWGIFEDVRMFTRADKPGKVFAVATTPFSIGNAHDASFAGDFRLLDVTTLLDPEEDPADEQADAQEGTFPSANLGEVSVNGCKTFMAGRAAAPTPDGTHSILSFYDGSPILGGPNKSAAVFNLDNDNLPQRVPDSNPVEFDPEPPHWDYPADPVVEGNAADVQPFTGSDGRLLTMMSEDDMDPALTNLTIHTPGSAAGSWRGCETHLARDLYLEPNQEVSGDIVYLGRGCPGSNVQGTANPGKDDYTVMNETTDLVGKIALLDSGGSGFDDCGSVDRVKRAAAAGATAVMINLGGNGLSLNNNGANGGIPQIPVISIPLSSYSLMQRVPTPVPTATAFPTTYERSSTTNVTMVTYSNRDGMTRTDRGRFRSVADSTDRDARGQVNAASRFPVTPGESYEVGAFVEVASRTAGAFQTSVVWYDASGAEISESPIAPPLAAITPRTRYESVAVAPPLAEKGAVRFEWDDGVDEGTPEDDDAGTAFVDSFEFVPVGLTGTLKDNQGAWGSQHIIDFSQDPPATVGSYQSPTATQWPPPDDGLYGPRLARMFGSDLAFTTWLSDGLRVLDVSDPSAPEEVASYVPPGADDPSPFAGIGEPPAGAERDQAWPDQPLVTGVDIKATGASSGIVAISDINAGLYLLTFEVDTQGVACRGYDDDVGNHVIGTNGSDLLLGTPGKDIICGLGGNDTLKGFGGDDILLAGGGHDRAVGGRGADRVDGGRGSDRLTGGGGKDLLLGRAGGDRLEGNAGADRLRGHRGDDDLFGGRGRDSCRQGPGRGIRRSCERH